MEENSGKVNDTQYKEPCEEVHPAPGKETLLKLDPGRDQCVAWINRPTPETVQRLIARLLDKL